MFFQLFPIRLPRVDVEPDARQIIRKELLDFRFVAGDARNGDHLLQEADGLVLSLVYFFQNLLAGIRAHGSTPQSKRAVMAGLDPAIHVLTVAGKAWMPG